MHVPARTSGLGCALRLPIGRPRQSPVRDPFPAHPDLLPIPKPWTRLRESRSWPRGLGARRALCVRQSAPLHSSRGQKLMIGGHVLRTGFGRRAEQCECRKKGRDQPKLGCVGPGLGLGSCASVEEYASRSPSQSQIKSQSYARPR